MKINLQLVDDKTDMGQTLKTFGGMIALLEYEVYFEKEQKNAGKVFVDWDVFDELDD